MNLAPYTDAIAFNTLFVVASHQGDLVNIQLSV